MDELVARCRSCGYEQSVEFATCPVCVGVSGWWCVPCRAWQSSRFCPACGGLLIVPPEVTLGAYPPGSAIKVRFMVRNPGKKPLSFSLECEDGALSLRKQAFLLKQGEETAINGTLILGRLPPGHRNYQILFNTPIPTKTNLLVEVVPAVVGLELTPTDLIFRNARPGTKMIGGLIAKNTGNVPLKAKLSGSEPWLSVLPPTLELEPGKSKPIQVSAQTRRSDYGLLVGKVRALALGGHAWESSIKVYLPEPKVESPPVDFADVRPDRPAYETVTLRNVGKVRVACTLISDQPWLAVAPGRVNLPVGGEKQVRLRATLPAELEGLQSARLIVSFAGGQLLRIPITATCRVPKPILGPVRRRPIGAVATDATVVRRFRVSNEGDGRLTCTVTADQPWVEVLTSELTVAPGKKRRVEFRLNTPSMPRGVNQATIKVRSNGGTADVPISVTVVEPEPELEVAGEVDLGLITSRSVGTGHVMVRNVGVGLLSLAAGSEDSRVTVTPTEMSLSPGPPTKLAVAVSVAGLAGGLHRRTLQFTSNGGAGWTSLRFQLPVEEVDASDCIDLGDRVAGRQTGDAIRVRNTGADPVTLSVRADQPWVRPVSEWIIVPPGKLLAVPFRVDLPSGIRGPVSSTIVLEGRYVRHEIAIRAVARKVEVGVIPHLLDLGDMIPGRSRPITFQIANTGELEAVIPDVHVKGNLEVWIGGQTVQPGATVTLMGRAKLNAQTVGKQVRTSVLLTDEASATVSAKVVRRITPAILAGVAGFGGLVGGVVLGLSVGWMPGAILAVPALLLLGRVWLGHFESGA